MSFANLKFDVVAATATNTSMLPPNQNCKPKTSMEPKGLKKMKPLAEP